MGVLVYIQHKKMVSLSDFLLLLFLCTPLFLFILHKWRRRHAPTSLKTPPPSPPKLPVIGNLHQLGLFPHRTLHSLSRRYGQLMQLHLGSVPVVIASSPEAAREIMKTQDLTFSNRPKLSIPSRLLYNGRDVGFAPYGDHWRQARSICVLQLLSNKRVQSYRRVREEETSIMVEKITQLGSSAVDLSEVLMSLTNDVICRIALGKKYGGERNFKEMIAEFEELMGISPVWEYIPWLSWTRRFDGVDQRVERVAKAFNGFLESVIKEHKEREKVGGDGDGELDFVDILLEFQRENESSSPVEDDAIKGIIMDAFVAGSDTTVTHIEWAMAELIKNPSSMRALQKEVRETVGNGVIEEKDIEKMAYLKAVMKESLRLHVPVPLLLPRESTQDTKVLGYDVASGTRVVVNAWAIAKDPTLWENPEEFHPHRFLSKTNIDYRGMHFELIPFGAGRRGCPGITFTMLLNELALAKLVHAFDFRLPNGQDLDMTEACGLTIHKKNPLLLIATPHAS